MYAYREEYRQAQSSQSIVAAAIDSTVDAATAAGKLTVDVATAAGKLTVDVATAAGKLTVDVITAPYYGFKYIWPKSTTDSYEKQMFKYNINLDLYLQNSVVKKLNQEQKLLICAAAASLPSGDPHDNENNRKILIAFLASALLATSGVAIVVYTGSSGLLPTLLIETGSSGINHCIKTIESNEKFLWKEWSKDVLISGAETLVLGGLNKLRQKAPFGIRGPVTRDIINALCSVYDIIEPYSNVIICIIKGSDQKEIAFEALKSIDKQCGTCFSGVTFFEIKSVNNVSRQEIDRYSGSYATVERVVNNIAFKIYYDRSISIDIN